MAMALSCATMAMAISSCRQRNARRAAPGPACACASCGQDQRGRPEGHVLEIVERPTKTLIGRLLQESGVWLVAPEDKRYGQDVLVPQGRDRQAKTGQVVVVELDRGAGPVWPARGPRD